MSNEANNTKQVYRVTLWGSVVNFLLLALKFVAGIVGNSAAMVADAVHSLSDFVTDLIVIAFVRISGKPEDSDHNYGHGKYETLATIIIGIILFGVGVGILVNAVESIVAFARGEALAAPGWLALAAAAISIISKELLYQYTVRKGKLLNSKAVIANAWHHRSDAFSSIGTLVGIGGAILLGENWRVLDPIAAVVVSAFIVKVAIDLVKPCVEELLERSVEHVDEQVLEIVKQFPDISSPHHLRSRRIGNNIAIELHIRMDGNITLEQAHRQTTELERAIKRHFGDKTHVGIHTEPIK